MARSSSAQRRVDPATARRAFTFRVFGEVVQELKRVTWPTRDETMRLTLMVIAVSATVGVFLGLVDIGFSRIFNVILNN
jgi:preprotein translocase subunit SecE